MLTIERKNNLLQPYLTDEVRAILIDGLLYTFSNTHTSLADIPQAARKAISLPLTTKAISGGIATSAPAICQSVPLQDPFTPVVLIYSVGQTEEESLLWGRAQSVIVTNQGGKPTGEQFYPAGLDVIISFPAGTVKLD